jgi:large subunit ribosomal protein L1
MGRRGKKYLEAVEKVDKTRLYSPEEALDLAKEVSYANFDASVELHVRTGLDPRRQQVRGTVTLPHGLGKTVRVVVFAAGEDAQIAEGAGADFVISDDEGIQKINEGWTDFDVAIAVPQMMPKVGRLGRILGPRGLMPNPKTGTVVQGDDLDRAIKAAKAGRIEYRLDRSGNIHCPLGKVSFPTENLKDNMAAVMEVLRRERPAAVNPRTYMRRVTVAPTMGPGIKVDPREAMEMEVA